ncbi:MAG: acetyl-CoA carboxylase carboxyl transferase subunit beta [Zetaproteobacteria bacterium CG12_big_fil_rev_8_21_14_0_65_54_13]|nr:MAG: acetyl-CoA carboxylase carboxyl transferase subunit beta [Zetaproteobacteria bacterium CG23_combo_of_CG06-09_8_20_14_all_54_7]PIW48258.1 MAG: acetyl-CoA carboxylase carboxyl transferase subunit beta [Zetaproteobacteria bacterium CG12_big_fil_rev_8_21_14_0_65_54_13]PIX54558.1 MAG: acetyl-CoA carboxylase carboxyl transferase subunit beta [Zetaproteobacteria bacterium CG_4_10_14_3_um_filter_54_28]PJA29724.1 MAG: acetyl-CoA carboxylase carboxyl transferase subunit beta [Zetaproteobacteria ba
MSWFTRLIEAPKNILKSSDSGSPEGLWVKCPSCSVALYNKDLTRSGMVCGKCGHHLRMSAAQRAGMLFDEATFEEHDTALRSEDPLTFKDQKRYKDRTRDAAKKAGPEDAVRNYIGDINGRTISASIFEFAYMGGSMGSVAGEKIVRGMEHALERGCPYLLVTASGGARMQEGVLALMQMAKTSSTVNRLNDAKLPFICLLTDPTMGGVSASVAWLGDVILAEPNALIGFAGPRVIQETVGQKLPEGFQRAEFLLSHGLIDDVVDRRELSDYLTTLLTHLCDRPYRQPA